MVPGKPDIERIGVYLDHNCILLSTYPRSLLYKHGPFHSVNTYQPEAGFFLAVQHVPVLTIYRLPGKAMYMVTMSQTRFLVGSTIRDLSFRRLSSVLGV